MKYFSPKSNFDSSKLTMSLNSPILKKDKKVKNPCFLNISAAQLSIKSKMKIDDFKVI